jgi:hypothetical protein
MSAFAPGRISVFLNKGHPSIPAPRSPSMTHVITPAQFGA